jgi:hypothetical protein
MKTIKLFVVAIIATITSSCSNQEEPKTDNATLNKIAGTTWTTYLEKASLVSIGTYTLSFQKDTNICTMQFNRIVKNEAGVIISNTTVTKTGTYNVDKKYGDRGSIIFPDIPSNNVTMYFGNGISYLIYTHDTPLSSGITQNIIEVTYGKNYQEGAGFQVIFTPIIK